MAFSANIHSLSINGRFNETINLCDEETGDPLDLTGCAFALSFRHFGGCNEHYKTINNDSGDIYIVGQGCIEIRTDLFHGVYSIFLQGTRDEFVFPILTGTLSLQRGL